mmetsp:Transcript_4558/g.12457  ORF Transcript_4558/g.12457 Transcript_4558/m.12457 type:complete len:217 (-) Transcript_4558:1618-2268(-)
MPPPEGAHCLLADFGQQLGDTAALALRPPPFGLPTPTSTTAAGCSAQANIPTCARGRGWLRHGQAHPTCACTSPVSTMCLQRGQPRCVSVAVVPPPLQAPASLITAVLLFIPALVLLLITFPLFFLFFFLLFFHSGVHDTVVASGRSGERGGEGKCRACTAPVCRLHLQSSADGSQACHGGLLWPRQCGRLLTKQCTQARFRCGSGGAQVVATLQH